MKTLGIVVVALTATMGVGAVVSGQKAGWIDAPIVKTASVADDLVGDWRGTLYMADPTRDFARIEVTFRFTNYGVLRFTRGPITGGPVVRPIEDTGFADYKVVGNSVILSLHGSGFPLELVGVQATGNSLEFVIPKEVALGGTLVEGGYVLTRQ